VINMSIFYDVDAFMAAAGHTPDPKRVSLYLDLVREEVGELEEAMSEYHAAENRQDEQLAKADALDAICDSIWVLVGLARVMDLPIDQGWDAVTISNLRKVDPELGTVIRDENGKIQKPQGWRPPDMLRIIQNYDNRPNGLAKAETGE
jgi:predicted HAD superfamily Cof-like phosphohydrolase